MTSNLTMTQHDGFSMIDNLVDEPSVKENQNPMGDLLYTCEIVDDAFHLTCPHEMKSIFGIDRNEMFFISGKELKIEKFCFDSIHEV